MRRKSTLMKALHNNGDSRTKETQQYPLVLEDSLRVPAYLPKIAKQLYRSTANLLIGRRVFQVVDLPLLEAYSSAYAIYREALADLNEHGAILVHVVETRNGKSEKRYPNPAAELMRRQTVVLRDVSAKFGLSPLDRQKLEATLTDADIEDDDSDDEVTGYYE